MGVWQAKTLPVAYTKEKKLYIEQIRVIIHLVDAEKGQRFLFGRTRTNFSQGKMKRSPATSISTESKYQPLLGPVPSCPIVNLSSLPEGYKQSENAVLCASVGEYWES